MPQVVRDLRGEEGIERTKPFYYSVIPRLGLGIHEFAGCASVSRDELVDGKAKPCHDELMVRQLATAIALAAFMKS